MYGAKLVKVESRTLKDRTAQKKGYPQQWVLHMSDVPEWAEEMWRRGTAYVNVCEYAGVRSKMKKKIKTMV